MILAQYGSIGIGLWWALFAFLGVTYAAGTIVGWLFISGLFRRFLRIKRIDILWMIAFCVPAFFAWLWLIRAFGQGRNDTFYFSLMISCALGAVISAAFYIFVGALRRNEK